MENITIANIQEMLGNDELFQNTIFMRQGRGKVVHLSVGDCRSNNLLCGVTYARNGSRNSFIYPLPFTQVNVSSMCKKCMKMVQNCVERNLSN